MPDDRREYLGSTDVPLVMGKSPYGNALTVYLEKVADQPPEQRHDPLLRLGSYLEPYVADQYREETGRALEVIRERVQHPTMPYLRAQIDRRVTDEDRGVEVKTASGWVFAKMVRQGLPEHYIIQGHIAQKLAGFADYDWIVLNRNTAEVAVFPQEFDPDFADWCLACAAQFWDEHVLPRIPPTPPPVEEIEPFDGEERTLDPESVASAMVAQLAEWRAIGKEADQQGQALRARLAMTWGDQFGRYQNDLYRVIYQQVAGRKSLNTKALVQSQPLDRIALMAALNDRDIPMEEVQQIVEQVELDFAPYYNTAKPHVRVDIRKAPEGE